MDCTVIGALPPGFKGSRVQGFKGSRVQGFKGSRVQGFKGSRVQGFKGSRKRVYSGIHITRTFYAILFFIRCNASSLESRFILVFNLLPLCHTL
jgi:hypothetical protein